MTLGLALAGLPSDATAANTGGAAPASPATSGGAAPGKLPPRPRGRMPRASSRGTGGALVGRKPRKVVVPRKQAAARPRVVTPKHATRRRVVVPTPSPAIVSGTFPLLGSFSFGGADARFGAERDGHVHQGQDVIAASGTPIVAPLAGSILWTANQRAGAGIYLVLHGGDARDYVFMHIKRHTLVVGAAEAVRRGQRLADVGATGDATGPHLHFEIWVGGWGTKTGHPIDPLPQLERWLAGRG